MSHPGVFNLYNGSNRYGVEGKRVEIRADPGIYTTIRRLLPGFSTNSRWGSQDELDLNSQWLYAC